MAPTHCPDTVILDALERYGLAPGAVIVGATGGVGAEGATGGGVEVGPGLVVPGETVDGDVEAEAFGLEEDEGARICFPHATKREQRDRITPTLNISRLKESNNN